MATPIILTITWNDGKTTEFTLEPMNVGPIIRVLHALSFRNLIKTFNISG